MENQVFRRTKHVTQVHKLEHLRRWERAPIERVADKFSFRSTEYYLSLIDWNDPNDPIRTIIVPHERELDRWGELDPSNEQAYTVMPGVEHKYRSTVLMLVSDTCAGICRYCFRKRVFIQGRHDCVRDIPAAIDYIRCRPCVTNVLLTGGDPLTLPTTRLEDIIAELRGIDHVRIIRLGTKMPVFNPHRILEDDSLLQMLARYSTKRRRIYIMTHFVHPREVTPVAVDGVAALIKAGAIVSNQCPIIRGLNDDPDILAELWNRLSYIGAVPYYAFQCRPAVGNKAYVVPIEEGYDIVSRAKARVSGLAKRVRFVMSHSTGKIEIVGRTDDRIFMQYHRAARKVDSGRMMVFAANPKACWLDDYDDMLDDHRLM